MKRNVVKVIVLLATLIFSGCSKSEEKADDVIAVDEIEGVAINEKSFPDDVFRDYVKEEFDLNGDKVLSDKEISEVDTIILDGIKEPKYREIKSISGIEYFSELKDFRLFDCNIETADFSGNENLLAVYSWGEFLADINIENNLKLEEISIKNGQIKELDISNKTELKKLDLTGCPIEEIDLSKNEKLEYLDCSITSIVDIDVSNNPALTTLEVSKTGITNLDLGNNENLNYLICEGTALTSIDITNNPEMLSVYCNGTNIEQLDITKNEKLFEVHCDENTKIIGEEQLEILQRIPESE